MPRKPGPWYRHDRDMWYGTLQGQQHPLEVKGTENRKAADAAFADLVARMEAAAAALARIGSVPASVTDPTPATKTVKKTVAEFLAKKAAEVERERFSVGALKQYRVALEVHLCATFGERSVTSLVAEEIEEWADQARGGKRWSDTTRSNRLGAVGTFLVWAKHPLPLQRPAKESRGSETVLTDEQFAQVLAAYEPKYGGGDLRELLTVLRETGGRPQECARLTVESVDWSNTCAKLKEHKQKRKGGSRVLYFSAAAMVVLEAQRAKHQSGYLFRTRRGGPYREKAIVQQMERISKRVGFRAIAYGLGRHSFATKALVSGVPDTVVAALLGHKTTRMVHENYGHVGEQSRVLRDAVQKVSDAKTDQ